MLYSLLSQVVKGFNSLNKCNASILYPSKCSVMAKMYRVMARAKVIFELQMDIEKRFSVILSLLLLFCQKCLFLSIFFIQLRRHSSAIKLFQTQLIMFTEYGRKYVNWKCDRSSFYLWLWIYICYFHAYLPQYFSRYIRCIVKFLNLTFKYISRRFATLHTLTCQVLCIVSESLDI